MQSIKQSLLSLYFIFSCGLLFSQGFTFEWARFVGGASTDVGIHIAVDAQGNNYTAGRFQGTVDFDPSSSGTFNLTSAGDFDMFLLKLNSAGVFQWAIRIGGSGFDEMVRVAIAPNGDVCATGLFRGTVDFDPGNGTNEKTSAGDQDIAVMRFTNAGALVWVQTIGGSASDFSVSCDVDNNGRILTSGAFQNQCTFNYIGGTSTLTASANQDAFIICYNADGSLAWLNSISGALSIVSKSSVFDNAGNVLVAGRFSGSATFAPGVADVPLSSNGGTDIFVLKLNSSGNLLWNRTYGGASSEDVYTITSDNQNNVLVTGYFFPDTDLDPGSAVVNLPVLGGFDCFIQKLNPSGNFIWAVPVGGTQDENTYDIKCDAENAVYVVGDFFGVVDFNPGSDVFNLTSSGNNDIFTMKLNSDGEFQWAYKVGATFSQAGYAIDLDAQKNVYTTGTYSNNVDFDPTSGIQFSGNPQVFDVFILKIGQNCVLPTVTSLSTSVAAVCQDDSLVLQVNGQLNDATNWILTKNSCLSATVLSSTTGTFTITPTETATYFVRGVGGCVPSNDPNNCHSKEIVMHQKYNQFQEFQFCQGESITLPDGTTFTNIQQDFTHTVSLNTINGCDSILNFPVVVIQLPSGFTINSDTLIFTQYSPKGYNYQVLDCNNNFSSVNITELSQSGTFLLPGPGSYAIYVSYNQETTCSDTSACQAVLSDQTINFSNIKLYPNPFHDHFTITGIPSEVNTLKVLSITGQEMLNSEVKGTSITMNQFDQLPNGVYFIMLSGKNTQRMMKVVKS